MEKSGFFRMIITIFLTIVLAIVGVGIYFYHFHVFETVRICMPEEGENTNLTCEDDEQCEVIAKNFVRDINLTGAPSILEDNFNRVFEESIYCNGTCFVRDTRGFNPDSQQLEFLESCDEGEIEIAVDIRGKDAVETFKWIRG